MGLPSDEGHLQDWAMRELPALDVDLELLGARDPSEVTRVAKAYGPVLETIFGRFAVDRHHLVDIVQDFWIHILPRLHHCTAGTPFGPWLVAAAKNYRNSRARKDAKAAARTTDFAEGRELVDDGSTLDDEAQRRALERAVADALNRLPGREGEALRLTAMEGWSNVEAAQFMGVRPATVANLVRRAVLKLQGESLLEKFHDDL